MAQTMKNAALLASCHNQNSRPAAVFLRQAAAATAIQLFVFGLWIVVIVVLDLFSRRAMY
jgi:hypothetical protein